MLRKTSFVAPPLSLAKKYQKAAAARARANRHKPKPTTVTDSPPAVIIQEPPPAVTSIDGFGNLGTDIIDVDRKYNCGYEESVVREDSEAIYLPGTSSGESAADSGTESLDQQCRAEVAVLTTPTPSPYSQIMDPRTARQWLKAEKKRALGYNGQSERSKRRKEKDIRDQEEFRKQARTSTNPQTSMMRTFFAPPSQPRQQTAELTPAL